MVYRRNEQLRSPFHMIVLRISSDSWKEFYDCIISTVVPNEGLIQENSGINNPQIQLSLTHGLYNKVKTVRQRQRYQYHNSTLTD